MGHATDDYQSIFCWYCNEKDSFVSFSHSNDILSRAEKKISLFVDQVPWDDPPSDVEDLQVCPLTLSSQQVRCSGEEHNLITLALSEMNYTFYLSDGRWPAVGSHDWADDGFEFVAWTESLELALITSDGLSEEFDDI